MKRIKIAVAGCGDIAHIRYFYALQYLKDHYELIAVHDRGNREGVLRARISGAG